MRLLPAAPDEQPPAVSLQENLDVHDEGRSAAPGEALRHDRGVSAHAPHFTCGRSGLTPCPRRGRRRIGPTIGAAGEAERRVRDSYGGRKASPRILACLGDRCYDRIGGGGVRGVAVLNAR
ncbi:hypothetical protein GCM10027612_64320 [Microbispora bryophytorum subsp. camponoti]